MYCFNLGLAFERVVHDYPDHTAFWFDQDKQFTYMEINAKANQAARFLLEQSDTIGDVVCLEGEKSLDTFCFLLGCLKIGRPYVVLDPDSPASRLCKIISSCRPKLILGRESFIETISIDEDTTTIWAKYTVDSQFFKHKLQSLDTEAIDCTRLIHGDTPAYIMFTSGSTGFPKGAVMTHNNVLNLIDWSRTQYHLVPEDIMTNVNPIYFDNSIFDFYAALFNGATLVPFLKEEVQDPQLLIGKLELARCAFWFSVPSLLIYLQNMRALNGKFLRTITRFSFGGEGYPKAKLKQLFDAYKDSAQFFNVYGPTECTCICSSYKLSDKDFHDIQGLPPLGYMAPNFGYLILDDQEEMIPAGEVGELCLLGPQVGKGYYNDPDRTAFAFKQNPHNPYYHDIMYKTGDLVKKDPEDGKLYVYGRKDNQIKHMGYRIELEEIETACHCLDYVSEAAAIHGRKQGNSQIVCILSQDKAVDDEQVKSDLRQLIPAYMLPTCIYREDSLPKNPNGKLDRRQLQIKYFHNSEG